MSQFKFVTDELKAFSQRVCPKKNEEIKDSANIILDGILNQIPKQNNEITDVHPLISTNDCTSNSSLPSIEQILAKILANSSLSITLQQKMKQNKYVSETNSTIVKPAYKLNTELATTLASDSEPNFLQSAQEQFISKNQEKLFSSNLEHNNKQLFESIIPKSEQHLNQNEDRPFIFEYISIGSSSKGVKYDYNFDEQFNYGTNNQRHKETCTNTDDFTNLDFGFIYDISQKVVLPNNFWNILCNEKQNEIIFFEEDELSEPIKIITLRKSLVPEIILNNVYYNYKEAIISQLDLENLLEKINNIVVCLGYDGQVHKNCIGYYVNDEDKEENEVCDNCRKLIKGKHSNIK